MKRTLLSHFYNEEYLLPHWLNHHKKYFTDGILVNYGSTDNSCDIIRQVCPTWKIINSKENEFGAMSLDRQMSELEIPVEGWRIVLNTTEFLIGNYHIIDKIQSPSEFFIPSILMADSTETQYTDIRENILSERTYGISPYDSVENFRLRRARRLGNFFRPYNTGRHFEHYDTQEFIICWYGFSPFNEHTIKRKLQIQSKMPEMDKRLGLGVQHVTDRDKLIMSFEQYQKKSRCVKDLITRYG